MILRRITGRALWIGIAVLLVAFAAQARAIPDWHACDVPKLVSSGWNSGFAPTARPVRIQLFGVAVPLRSPASKQLASALPNIIRTPDLAAVREPLFQTP